MSDDPVLMALAQLGSELRGDSAAIRADLTTFRTDLMARLDRMQDSITAIRDDIGVNMGAADNAKEAAHSTRKELRGLSEMVTAMQRQIMRLQTQVRELRGDP